MSAQTAAKADEGAAVVSVICEIFEPLSTDERARAMAATAASLGIRNPAVPPSEVTTPAETTPVHSVVAVVGDVLAEFSNKDRARVVAAVAISLGMCPAPSTCATRAEKVVGFLLQELLRVGPQQAIAIDLLHCPLGFREEPLATWSRVDVPGMFDPANVDATASLIMSAATEESDSRPFDKSRFKIRVRGFLGSRQVFIFSINPSETP